jgi:hypothetical protein
MTHGEKFYFLYDLPDSIIIKGIDLILEKYVSYNLAIFNEARKNNEYKVFKEDYIKTNGAPKIAYGAINNEPPKPSFVVIYWLDRNRIYLRHFGDTPEPKKLFNDYYNICVGLNRIEVINSLF